MKKFSWKKALLMSTSLVLTAVLAIGGTLAYLTSEDSDVNVMTLGNVSIKQHEYERVLNEDGTYATDTIDGRTSYVLKEFTQGKDILPIVGDPNGGYDPIPVRMTQVGSYGGMDVLNVKNAVDKFVTVENTGKTDAYVRTIVAIEVGSADPSLISYSWHFTWNHNNIGPVEIEGNTYYLHEFIYSGGKAYGGAHENGILPAGDTSYPNLSQIYIKSVATNEDMDKIDGNDNGQLDILVLSQAVQADGFANATAAFDAAFPVGENNANVASWLGGAIVENLGEQWDGTVDTSWYNDADTEFVITTAEQLAGFAKLVNDGNTFEGKTVKLGKNINLNGHQWTPIGNTSNYFVGTFDGQNYFINNMTINANTPDADQLAGLFGAVKKATIKNLVMDDSNINVVGSTVRAAAIVGFAYSNENRTDTTLNFENITVDGCNITAEATSSTAAIGGIAGYCYPANQKNITVSDLTMNVESVKNVFVSAMAGYQMGQNISNNGNTRAAFTIDTFNLSDIDITAKGASVYAGGYTGYSYYGYRTIKNGSVEGIKMDVDSTNAFVGGLVGQLWRGDNLSTVNDVNISGIDFDVTTAFHGETRVGGMVGTSQGTVNYTDCSTAGKITEQCNTGVVNHHAKVGGFVGRAYTWAHNFTNCVADVDITASHVAGGFIGNHITSASYTNCEAKGDVTANIAGGFAGRLTEHGFSTAVTFDGCKASGNVTGTNVAGGFIGSTADHGWAAWAAGNGNGYGKNITIKNCTITGTVSSGTDYCDSVIGEVKVADGVVITLNDEVYPAID